MPSSVLAFESGFPLFKICHFNLLLPNVGGIITLPLFLLQTSVPTTAATTTCRLCWHTKAAPAHQVTMWDGSRGKKVTTVVSHSTVFSMCVVISMLYIHMHTGTWVYTDVQEHFLFFFFSCGLCQMSGWSLMTTRWAWCLRRISCDCLVEETGI